MISESQARDFDRPGSAARRKSGLARLVRDIRADWRRWSGLERATATMVAALSAFVPLYLVLTLTQVH